jgi:hypothetical protein
VIDSSVGFGTNSAPASAVSRWTEVCGNRDCCTGWLRLWRSRAAPRFEGKWACSANCMERIIAHSIRGQIESWERSPGERTLRMPLGLILLSRGWIRQQELQDALASQRHAQHGRIGEWLRRLHGISEETIAKALAIQWSCAVLPAGMPGLELASAGLPMFLQHRYDLTLVRQGADGALYLAGQCRAEHAACRAMEHMLRVPVQAAFLEDHAWDRTNAATDSSELVLPGREGVVARICQRIEGARPNDARVVRIHDHLWLRMWFARRGRQPMHVRDVVLPLQAEDGLLRAN